MNTKTIAWITGGLTFLLALSSFILSFNALTDLAAKNGISIPYLFPLVVEAGVIIFSLNALYRSLTGESAKWQWALIISSSLLAGCFNVAHAGNDLLSRVMSAMPSLFLLLSFETFVSQIKHAVQHSSAIQSLEQVTEELTLKRSEFDQWIEQKCQELDSLIAAKQAELGQLYQEINTLNSSIELEMGQLSNRERAIRLEAEQDSSPIGQRRTTLLNILAAEGDIGASALAHRLNTSRGTVYSDLRTLSEAGQIVKNGNGWEVSV